MTALQRPVAMWLCFLLALSISCVYVALRYPGVTIGGDAAPLWCATRVVFARANPYTNEPLLTCERTPPVTVSRDRYGATMPAPLPPYAFAAAAPLALLPYPLFLTVWTLLLVLATIAAALGICRVTGLPAAVTFAVVPIGVLAPSILYGSFGPIAVALVVWAAVFLQRERWTAATVVLGFAMISPAMAMPACLAAFLLVPKMRLRLAVAGACACALSVAAVGAAAIAYYISVELPAQAFAEATANVQYSLTTLLYHLGVPVAIALRAASAQYAVGVLVGLFVAHALFARTKDLAVLVLVPAGFAMVGGTYVHLTELAMLIPLACWVAARYPSPAAWGALLLLALPLDELAAWPLLAVPAGCIVAWLLARTQWLRSRTAPVAFGAVAAISLGVIAALVWLRTSPFSTSVFPPASFRVPPAAANAASSVTAGEWAAQFSTVSPLWWVERAWMFVAIVAIVAILMRHALRRVSVTAPALAAEAG